MNISKVEIFLEQREFGFLSPYHSDKNAPYLCSKIISTLTVQSTAKADK